LRKKGEEQKGRICAVASQKKRSLSIFSPINEGKGKGSGRPRVWRDEERNKKRGLLYVLQHSNKRKKDRLSIYGIKKSKKSRQEGDRRSNVHQRGRDQKRKNIHKHLLSRSDRRLQLVWPVRLREGKENIIFDITKKNARKVREGRGSHPALPKHSGKGFNLPTREKVGGKERKTL